MKIFYTFLILILLFSSCKKNDEKEYKEVYGETIYTDSFSPPEWENPISRLRIDAIDKDIGQFIKIDVMEPKLRKILVLIETFIKELKNLNNVDFSNIDPLLTPSALNSFSLRYIGIHISDDYQLRIAYPTSENNLNNLLTAEGENKEQTRDLAINLDTNNPNKQEWIKFKLIFPQFTIVSSLQIEPFGEDYKISDFESNFFTNLKEKLEKKIDTDKKNFSNNKLIKTKKSTILLMAKPKVI